MRPGISLHKNESSCTSKVGLIHRTRSRSAVLVRVLHVWLPFLIAALPICLADIKSYSIPNIYLIWLSFLCTPYLLVHGLGPVSRILLAFTILAILHLCGLGMGDVKLLAIVALLLNSDQRSSVLNLGFSISLCAVVYAITQTLWNRELPRKIPLAPSIFIGLTLYLATR